MTNPTDTKLYDLRITDRAGCSFYVSCLDWAHVRTYVSIYTGNDVVLDLFGEDHDCDWDGLTDEERDAFADLV